MALAKNQSEKIKEHIQTIRKNPWIREKEKAYQALAEIGLPAVAPLLDYLHEVSKAKPNDEIWISPGFLKKALVIVCKKVGVEAEKAIFNRFLKAKNKTEYETLFFSLFSSTPNALDYVLRNTNKTGILDHNSLWSIQKVIDIYVYGGFGRNEKYVSEIEDVFSKYPELEKKFIEINKKVQELKTVGLPNPAMTFSPQINQSLNISVKEQEEFSIELEAPDGPWGYRWGIGKGHKWGLGARVFKFNNLLFLGHTIIGKKIYFRFLGMKPVKTPLNVHIQGGVPDNDPPEYLMVLTVEPLSPEERLKMFKKLKNSLDRRHRDYAEKKLL